MRQDKDGKMYTLEQDIQYIWKQHGLIVESEKVENNTWTITATRECKDCEDAKRSSKEWPSIAVECHCGKKYQNGRLV